MAKVHFVGEARTFAVKIELAGATPILPLPGVVVLQFPKPQALDELEIPSAPLSLGLHPDAAVALAHALLQAVHELDQI